MTGMMMIPFRDAIFAETLAGIYFKKEASHNSNSARTKTIPNEVPKKVDAYKLEENNRVSFVKATQRSSQTKISIRAMNSTMQEIANAVFPSRMNLRIVW